MIRKLARKILKDDIDSMSETIESLRESNNTLRKEIDDFADVKLRLKVAEMYIDDNDAIDELLAAMKEVNKKKNEDEQRYNSIRRLGFDVRQNMQSSANNLANNSASLHSLGGLAGLGCLGGWL